MKTHDWISRCQSSGELELMHLRSVEFSRINTRIKCQSGHSAKADKVDIFLHTTLSNPVNNQDLSLNKALIIPAQPPSQQSNST